MTIQEQTYLQRHGIYEKRFARSFNRVLDQNYYELARQLEDNQYPNTFDTQLMEKVYTRLYLDIMQKEGVLVWNEMVFPETGERVKDIFDSIASDLPPQNISDLKPFWRRLMQGFLNTYISQRIIEVGNTTIKRFNEAVQKYRNDGLTNKEIANKIRADKRSRQLRANLIARTESTTAINKAHILALESSKMKWEKSWDAIKDEKTRDSHWNTDPNYWIDIKDNFIIGGFPMAYPGDSTQGSPIKEIARCRCMLRFRYAGQRFGFRPVRR